MRHPHVLQLIMDSLRYWVTEMHVDGFRFDLAVDAGPRSSTRSTGCPRSSTWSSRTRSCRQVKLIAEPWDVGEGGYQVGNFPPLWTEWNGKYRDTVRDFWRGEPRHAGGVRLPADRLAPTSTQDDGRRPFASINFVTAHDGFTLHDLVSYNDKHNEANGEDNRDGESHNRSWNCGAEGATDDLEVIALREQAEAQLPDHAVAVAGRADAARTATSWAAPSRATTTPTARTTSSPGSTGSAPSDDEACSSSSRALIALRARPPGLPPPPVLPRPAGPRRPRPARATSPGSRPAARR